MAEQTQDSPLSISQPGGLYRVDGKLVDANGKPAQLEGAAAGEPEGGKPPEINATDGAKAFATENGIDLATVKGTGENGRITKPDVEAALDAAAE